MILYEDKGLLAYAVVMAAILGAVLGSFLNCTAWRIAHGEKWTSGRSHCPSCGHELGVRDLFPILSWVLLKGKCRYCGAKVSARYPLTEAFFALVTVTCLLKDGLTLLFVRDMIFLSCLFCLSLVDLDSYIIPDGCHVISILAWMLYLPFSGWSGQKILIDFLAAVIFGGGVLLIALIMDKILKKESLGGGDVKLFAVMGLYLGLAGSLFAMMLACVLGLLLALVRRGENGRIPFGPAIAAATAVMLLFGSPLVDWYMSLLG
ncbi:MAG: prepilin peptidase [Ruminococcaceae bacterium]|jgi:leader peptidase (prepilin peptidase)/N-methyltransferase|nr:prepilin peptidase [Oscillospiraceae bacterium]